MPPKPDMANRSVRSRASPRPFTISDCSSTWPMKEPEFPPRTTPGAGFRFLSNRRSVLCQPLPYQYPSRNCGRSPGCGPAGSIPSAAPATTRYSCQSRTTYTMPSGPISTACGSFFSVTTGFFSAVAFTRNTSGPFEAASQPSCDEKDSLSAGIFSGWTSAPDAASMEIEQSWPPSRTMIVSPSRAIVSEFRSTGAFGSL